MKTETKKCYRCSWNGKKALPWTCRSCNAKCCEHRCSLKTNDGFATCGSCQIASCTR